MYYEDDIILRVIHMIIRAVVKIVFGKDIDQSFYFEVSGEEEKSLLLRLLNLVDRGEINSAENLLFQNLDRKNKQMLLLSLKFYSYLSEIDEIFLNEYDFSRREILQGIKDVLKFYNLEDLNEIFRLYL